MHPRTEKKLQKLREIARDILCSEEFPTYKSQCAEIAARYDISPGRARIDHMDAKAYLPEVVAAKANEIRAAAVIRADHALGKGMEIAANAKEYASLAQASTSLVATLERIDPTQWLTAEESITAILQALASHELTEEQVGLLGQLYRRMEETQ